MFKKKYIKNKRQKSKQFNLYEKLTKAKSNFNSNQIFSKFWLYIYIYIYLYIYIYYLVLFILDSSFNTKLTHLTQKFKSLD